MIVCAPVPIPKTMWSSPTVAFASWIAARSVHPVPRPAGAEQMPSPGVVSEVSTALFTVNVCAQGTARQAEYSDVVVLVDVTSVAVAVMK